MLMNQKHFIEENSKKFRKRKCAQHKISYVQKVCTHPNCIESMTSNLLCNQCFRKHAEDHKGIIQYFLEFDKIFSDNVFVDIELLESDCLNLFLEKKQKLDTEVDRHFDLILEEVKQLLESIKFRIKVKYGSNNLIKEITKLKESLLNEYNTLFTIDEANIKDKDIKQYIEFYINFEKMFEENQANNEEMFENLEKEFDRISRPFDQKLEDIRLILESDEIE